MGISWLQNACLLLTRLHHTSDPCTDTQLPPHTCHLQSTVQAASTHASFFNVKVFRFLHVTVSQHDTASQVLNQPLYLYRHYERLYRMDTMYYRHSCTPRTLEHAAESLRKHQKEGRGAEGRSACQTTTESTVPLPPPPPAAQPLPAGSCRLLISLAPPQYSSFLTVAGCDSPIMRCCCDVLVFVYDL